MTSLPRTGKAGFTLVETLTAFAITALILIPAFRAVSMAFDVDRRSGFERTAAAFAKSKLAGVGLWDSVAESGASGVFSDRYRWSLAAVPYREGKLAPDLSAFWVTLTVSRESATGQTDRFVLTTLKLAKP